MSKFTFDHFHHYRTSVDESDHVKSQPLTPSIGQPGHRYGNGSPLPGASLKGRYTSPSNSSITSYKPSVKPPPHPTRTNRSNSVNKIPLHASLSLRSDNNPAYRSNMSDTMSLPGRFSSTPRSSSTSASPYAAILSRSPSAASSKRSRAFMTPFDPEEPFGLLTSSSSSVGNPINRHSYSQPLQSTSSSSNKMQYLQTYPSPHISSSMSVDGAGSSPRYRGISQNSTRNNKDYDNQSVSSLGSSTRYSKKVQPPRYSRSYNASIPTAQEIKAEKLLLLAAQFRDALVEDARIFDDVVPNEVYFPTKCPRSATLQDARARIVQMTLMWKHASILTVGSIDHVRETYQHLKSQQQVLRKNLTDKHATVDLMMQQQRSLGNYLDHLRSRAAEQGLGSLVYERNPLLANHIEQFAKNSSKHPIDDQLYNLPSDHMHSLSTSQSITMPPEKKEREKGAINLLDVNNTADAELFDSIPTFAKKLLSSNWKSLDAMSAHSSHRSSVSSRSSSPSVSRSNSITSAGVNYAHGFISPRLQPRPPSANVHHHSTAPSSSASSSSQQYDDQRYYDDDDAYTGYDDRHNSHQSSSSSSQRPSSRIASQRGHFITPLDTNQHHQSSNVDDDMDVDLSHLDEWGLAISAATPSANANAMAKSMALKNLSIRAMIALSPHKRILDKANGIDMDADMDSFDNFHSPTDNDNERAMHVPASDMSLTPTPLGRERAREPSMSTGFGSAVKPSLTSPDRSSTPSRSSRMRIQPPAYTPMLSPSASHNNQHQHMISSPHNNQHHMTSSSSSSSSKSPQFNGMSLEDLVNVDFMSPDRVPMNGHHQHQPSSNQHHRSNIQANNHHHNINYHNNNEQYRTSLTSNHHNNSNGHMISSDIENGRLGLATQQGFAVQNRTPQELSASKSSSLRDDQVLMYAPMSAMSMSNPALNKPQRQPIAASHFLKSVVSAVSPRPSTSATATASTSATTTVTSDSTPHSTSLTPTRMPKRPPPRVPD